MIQKCSQMSLLGISYMSQDERQNQDFVQVGRKQLNNMRVLVRKSPLAAEILFFLIDKATVRGNTSNAVIMSPATFQEVTGYSRASITRAIKVLKDGNWIQAVKIGGAHAYAVNERVAWREAGNKRQYATFSATVIAAASEQPAGVVGDKTKLNKVPVLQGRERALLDNERLPPPDQMDIDV